MKIYGVEITGIQSVAKPDLRHDWLVRQYEDCKVMTDRAITKQ